MTGLSVCVEDLAVKLLRQVITMALLAVSLMIGFPIACFGIVGLSGGLADTSERENVEVGIQLLLFAGAIFAPTALWIVYLVRRPA